MNIEKMKSNLKQRKNRAEKIREQLDVFKPDQDMNAFEHVQKAEYVGLMEEIRYLEKQVLSAQIDEAEQSL